jgi:hypothetical protein
MEILKPTCRDLSSSTWNLAKPSCIRFWRRIFRWFFCPQSFLNGTWSESSRGRTPALRLRGLDLPYRSFVTSNCAVYQWQVVFVPFTLTPRIDSTARHAYPSNLQFISCDSSTGSCLVSSAITICSLLSQGLLDCETIHGFHQYGSSVRRLFQFVNTGNMTFNYPKDQSGIWCWFDTRITPFVLHISSKSWHKRALDFSLVGNAGLANLYGCPWGVIVRVGKNSVPCRRPLSCGELQSRAVGR